MSSAFIFLLPAILFLADSTAGIPVKGVSYNHHHHYNEDASMDMITYQLFTFRVMLGVAISGLLILSYTTTSWQVKKYCTVVASSLSILQLLYAFY